MIKKRAIAFSILMIFILSFALAQNNVNNTPAPLPPSSSSSAVVEKAYQCITNQINSKDQTSLSLQEAIFGILALGSNQKLTSVIESKKLGNEYWGESQSQLKDTAQVLLAYKRINRNTDSIKNWLSSKSISATDLIWYLQIDIQNRQQSSCTLSYDQEQRTVTINTEMTISGNPGSCLSITPSGFWLKVNNNCIDKNYTISCDQDFITSLLYQKQGSQTLYVSPITNSAPLSGTTRERINSKCFSTTGNTCDYEGSLWAAMALDSAGVSITKYLPYLLALSESNQRFLPSAFLHKITSGTDQYSQLVQSQQQSKFWQAPNTPYNRYYDSALAMLSLKGTSSAEFTNSQNYFESIVTQEGCWNNNNIRDTGFLLYAGWPRSVASTPGTTPSSQTCTSAGYTCASSLFSCGNLNGQVLDYSCSTGVCCSASQQTQSCSELEGVICPSGKTCSGTTSQSTEGSCCLATCQTETQTNSCVQAGGGCYSSCNSNEEQISESCGSSSSELCCKAKISTEGESSFTFWIIMLVILIALVVLGIVFKDKIKLMFYKMKNKGPSNQQPPRGMPPPRGPPFPPSRPIPPRGQPRFIPNQQQIRRPVQQNQDKEMEETMRKLKEMSK